MIKIRKKRSQRIKYIILFLVIFITLNISLINIIGKPLIDLQVNIIKYLFSDLINYQNFIFVAHCSGIISIITYLSLIIPFYFLKIHIKISYIIKNILILLIYNFFRLIIILLSSLINLKLAEIVHVLSWFVLFFIIFYLVKKDLNKINLDL